MLGQRRLQRRHNKFVDRDRLPDRLSLDRSQQRHRDAQGERGIRLFLYFAIQITKYFQS